MNFKKHNISVWFGKYCDNLIVWCCQVWLCRVGKLVAGQHSSSLSLIQKMLWLWDWSEFFNHSFIVFGKFVLLIVFFFYKFIIIITLSNAEPKTGRTKLFPATWTPQPGVLPASISKKVVLLFTWGKVGTHVRNKVGFMLSDIGDNLPSKLFFKPKE